MPFADQNGVFFMKKKLVYLLMTAMILGSLSACGTKKEADTNKGTGNSSGTLEQMSNEINQSGEKLSTLDTTKYITLGEYKGLNIDVAYEPVTQEEIDAYVDSLVANCSTSVALGADETVKTGNEVHFSCVGTIDGVVFEGGSSEEGEDWNTVIGEGTMIPGFEDGFIGMKVGESKTITATFPDDYQNAEYAGKTAQFAVVLNAAENITYATEMSQAVVDYYGYETEEALRADVKNYFESTVADDYTASIENAIVEAAFATCTKNGAPQFLIDAFVANQKEYYEYYAEQYSMTIDEFITSALQTTKESYEESIAQIALEYAQQYLMYEAIFDTEGMELTQDDIDTAAKEMAASYGYSDVDSLYADFGKDDFRDYLMIEKVVALLVENSTNTNASKPE